MLPPLFLDFHLCGSSASAFLEAPKLLSAGAAFVLGSYNDWHAERPLTAHSHYRNTNKFFACTHALVQLLWADLQGATALPSEI